MVLTRTPNILAISQRLPETLVQYFKSSLDAAIHVRALSHTQTHRDTQKGQMRWNGETYRCAPETLSTISSLNLRLVSINSHKLTGREKGQRIRVGIYAFDLVVHFRLAPLLYQQKSRG